MPGLKDNFLTELLVGLGLLILCTLGYKTIAWFRQDVRGSARRDEDALLPFREAMEAGEISREEFERVRAALLRQKLQDADGLSAPPLQNRGGDPSTSETPSPDPS